MGAAEPVIASQTGEMQAASEKINSALRSDFANRAQFFDRNPLLAEAMVDKDIILVMRDGVIVKLDSENQVEATDKIISPKGKLLTLDARQLMEYGVADILILPTKLPLITEEERAEGKWPASKMQLFQYPFFKSIPQATISAFQMDWKNRFFAFLANPVVSSLLFLGLMVGFYIEFNTPGFGAPGLLALTCLFLILLSSFSTETINWLEIIIFSVGVLLILLEIFVLPGFGIPGVLGILLVVSGLFLMMLPSMSSFTFTLDPDKMTAAGQFFLEKLGWLCATIIIGFIFIYLLGKYVMPRLSRFNRLVLRGEQDRSAGYVAGMDIRDLPKVGSQGEAISSLRPSGKVLIDDTVYDAMSQGGFIDQGKKIKILYFEGSRMIVGESE
jgi:membrane-bound ClpP family serine protease